MIRHRVGGGRCVIYMIDSEIMTKGKSTNKLLQYLKGELSEQEAQDMERWADESKENEKELVSLANKFLQTIDKK